MTANLCDSLGMIQDDVFCIQSCLGAPCETGSETLALLQYADSRARQISDDIQMLGHVSTVQKSIRRFHTFSILQRIVSSTLFNWKEWNRFRVADLAVEISELFLRGLSNEAILIWQRHCLGNRIASYHLDDELMAHLDAILDSVPPEISTAECLLFLKLEIIPRIQCQSHM